MWGKTLICLPIRLFDVILWIRAQYEYHKNTKMKKMGGKGDNVKLRDIQKSFYQTISHVVITTPNHQESTTRVQYSLH